MQPRCVAARGVARVCLFVARALSRDISFTKLGNLKASRVESSRASSKLTKLCGDFQLR